MRTQFRARPARGPCSTSSGSRTSCCTSTSASRSPTASRCSRSSCRASATRCCSRCAAAIVTWGLAIPLGIISAVRQYSWVDKLGVVRRLPRALDPGGLLRAPPAVFAADDRLVPGRRDALASTTTTSTSAGKLRSTSCTTSRCPRSCSGTSRWRAACARCARNLLDVLRLDYVTTARAKGLDENTVVCKHARAQRDQPADHAVRLHARRAALGLVHRRDRLGLAGPRQPHARGDPGKQDLYLVMGSVLMASTMLVLGNLVADLLLAVADPRITYD